MKVLFCTDGSDPSRYAINEALDFLPTNCNIDVLYVVDWGLFPNYVTFPYEEEDGFPTQKTIGSDILDNTVQDIEKRGFKVSNTERIPGHPADVIFNTIKETCYDLVIMGSHGKKGIKNWLGSVSRKVVTKSSIPTFISRPPKEPQENPSKGVLFMVDGSECSYNAVKRTLETLNLKDYQIKVLTVKPGPESLPIEITMDNEWLENCLIKYEELAKEILEESRRIFEQKGLTASTVLLEGDPSDEILNYNVNNPQKLIVMGSHGREGFSELILGSVSKRVLDNAIGSVLIIPTKKKQLN